MLGATGYDRALPEYNREIILSLKYFAVENPRSARRFLKQVDRSIVMDDLTFMELNEHTLQGDIPGILSPMKEGFSVGVISEAGCPAVADPGADLVALAQLKGYNVVPLVGPSSVLLALMASGFNGQSFAFHGYLPVDASKRTERIRFYENRMYSENETQLFIETPYRNVKLLEDVVRICKPLTKLCVASNLTCEDEFISTRYIKDWTRNVPDINRKPALFLLYKQG
jgi:16S rRNA (cytidine1402-2'-O)-methyltransferase